MKISNFRIIYVYQAPDQPLEFVKVALSEFAETAVPEKENFRGQNWAETVCHARDKLHDCVLEVVSGDKVGHYMFVFGWLNWFLI